jgi:hypothetical protein
MFGNNNNQQLGDVSGVGLPGAAPVNTNDQTQSTSGISPAFEDAPTETSQSSTPQASADDVPTQDLSTPEITEHASSSNYNDNKQFSGTDDLAELKQQALAQLTPLVGHLEQTPEEKFRTTMMMIQASDDQSLIPQAFEAANAIEDEKAKAQALLDVVNEINYFSQKSQ